MLLRLALGKLHDPCDLAAPETLVNRKSLFTLVGRR